MAGVKRNRITLREVNRHLVCRLCRGYYIDATTIAECLHSFCRSCIIKYLEKNSFCPICEVQIHKTKPYLNLRLDKALQDIVYKLVPGLYHAEMARRREFYKNKPELAALTTPEQRGVEERLIFSPDDFISLSLEFVEWPDPEPECPSSQSSDSGEDFPMQLGLMKVRRGDSSARKESTDSNEPGEYPKRFFKCSATVSVSLLKRFLNLKFELTSGMKLEIMHKTVPLPDYYTLMDIAYIFTWKMMAPMRLYYTLTRVKPLKALPTQTVASSVKELKQAVSVKPMETELPPTPTPTPVFVHVKEEKVAVLNKDMEVSDKLSVNKENISANVIQKDEPENVDPKPLKPTNESAKITKEVPLKNDAKIVEIVCTATPKSDAIIASGKDLPLKPEVNVESGVNVATNNKREINVESGVNVATNKVKESVQKSTSMNEAAKPEGKNEKDAPKPEHKIDNRPLVPKIVTPERNGDGPKIMDDAKESEKLVKPLPLKIAKPMTPNKIENVISKIHTSQNGLKVDDKKLDSEKIDKPVVKHALPQVVLKPDSKVTPKRPENFLLNPTSGKLEAVTTDKSRSSVQQLKTFRKEKPNLTKTNGLTISTTPQTEKPIRKEEANVSIEIKTDQNRSEYDFDSTSPPSRIMSLQEYTQSDMYQKTKCLKPNEAKTEEKKDKPGKSVPLLYRISNQDRKIAKPASKDGVKVVNIKTPPSKMSSSPPDKKTNGIKRSEDKDGDAELLRLLLRKRDAAKMEMENKKSPVTSPKLIPPTPIDLSKLENGPGKMPLDNLLELSKKPYDGRKDVLKVPQYPQNTKPILQSEIEQALEYMTKMSADNCNKALQQANLQMLQQNYLKHIEYIKMIRRQQQQQQGMEVPAKMAKLSPPKDDKDATVKKVAKTMSQIQEEAEKQRQLVENYASMPGFLQFYNQAQMNRNSAISPNKSNLSPQSTNQPMTQQSFIPNLSADMNFNQMFQLYLAQQVKMNQNKSSNPNLKRIASSPSNLDSPPEKKMAVNSNVFSPSKSTPIPKTPASR